MNNKDLLKAIGDIDEKYLIEETDIEETNRIASNNKVNIMKNLKLKYILAPICIVFIAVIGLYKSGIFTSKPDIIISKKDDWIIKEVQVDKKDTPTDTAVIPKWNEMSISQQFNEVEYNNSKYSSRITKISNNNILKNIGNATLTGYDTYTETTYNKKAELYSIKDIEEKCAIAIKFEGDTDYYVYVNSYYRPTTLGEFTKDLNLEEIISFGTIYYNYWDEDLQEDINVEFYGVDNKIIWQKLFNNKNLENIYSDNDTEKYTSERFSQSIGISVDIPLLGYKNISVSLTDKGYLLTNILDTGKGFYIGEDKVQEFLDYIKDNYNGYKIVYVDESGSGITDEEVKTEKNIVEEKIMMTENTVNGYVTKEVDTNTITSNENKIEPYIPNN
ncbi:MAG: hypothetical protein ACLT3L_10355 [Clostridium sp.]|jgi:hypothetical protein|uniref:hypothetical protein n=1 Tax=Clostridium sp. TaxID=1506 RepID=UPI0015B76A29